MDAYITLITVFVSGLFGLLVAAVTAFLSNQKEARDFRRGRDQGRYENIRSLYIGKIAIIEKCIRRTQRLVNYDELMDELPRLNAELQLVANRDIINQAEVVSDLLFEWSTEFRQGMPKKVGDTGIAIVSNHDGAHHENAKKLYPRLMEEVVRLSHLMREHLESIEPRS